MLQLSQIKTAPNQLTLLRLIFVPFIVNAVIEGHYHVALTLFILAGVSDGLDGLLARALNQKTLLGQYLDPIADKLLLSALFLVLSFEHQIAWLITITVFSRDLIILVVCTLLYMTTELRDFRPSIYGKMNTVAQIAALFFVLLDRIISGYGITEVKKSLLWATFALTIFSALHYVWLVGERLKKVSGAHKSKELARGEL